MNKNYSLYSVVIPVYNSEKIILQTVNQIESTFKDNNLNYELVLVNDCSTDNSWEIIKKMATKNEKITAINLLKNYGQHNANMCGFRETQGDFIITIDDDLQNPPSEIIKLINKINDGYDLVIGQFKSKKHNLYRRLGSKFIGWLNRKIFNVKENLVLSNFRIANKDLIKRICNDNSFNPYIPGLFLKYSSKRANVEVEHAERYDGKSNYTLSKIFNLVLNLLFNHSSIPLKFGLIIGLFFSLTSFFASLYFLVSAIITGTSVPGWSSIVVALSFFNGLLILLISLIGQYIIRILSEVQSQPTYQIIEKVRNE
tara:strand:+ start:419 stop:1357 length:939 start_codon:yes stop_codon:yes gene_type:complete